MRPHTLASLSLTLAMMSTLTGCFGPRMMMGTRQPNMAVASQSGGSVKLYPLPSQAHIEPKDKVLVDALFKGAPLSEEAIKNASDAYYRIYKNSGFYEEGVLKYAAFCNAISVSTIGRYDSARDKELQEWVSTLQLELWHFAPYSLETQKNEGDRELYYLKQNADEYVNKPLNAWRVNGTMDPRTERFIAEVSKTLNKEGVSWLMAKVIPKKNKVESMKTFWDTFADSPYYDIGNNPSHRSAIDITIDDVCEKMNKYIVENKALTSREPGMHGVSLSPNRSLLKLDLDDITANCFEDPDSAGYEVYAKAFVRRWMSEVARSLRENNHMVQGSDLYFHSQGESTHIVVNLADGSRTVESKRVGKAGVYTLEFGGSASVEKMIDGIVLPIFKERWKGMVAQRKHELQQQNGAGGTSGTPTHAELVRQRQVLFDAWLAGK